MNKFNNILFALLYCISFPAICFSSVDMKIKFDNQTYRLSNPDTKTEKYVYLLKDENIGNWSTQIYTENINKQTNPTEAAAELAYKIQQDNPKAVVLVYPEAATIGYITFPSAKNFYEYNSVVFKNTKSGLEKFGYAKRFYSDKNGGTNGARTAAILFAEKNNKRIMEMINKQF